MAARDRTPYEALKRDITHFVFRPGERLVEEALSARYSVSRTPVREALRRLEQERLIVPHESGGRCVPHFDIAAFQDIYRVRAEVERLAARQACERASDEEIEQLGRTWDAAFRDDPDSPEGRYDLADERFHSGVAALSRNEYLIDCVHRINDRIRIIRMMDFNDPERIPITTGEHRAVLEALAARDADRAGDLLHAHVEQSIQTVRELVSQALERIYLS